MRVGDTVDGVHSCTSSKYGDCLYYERDLKLRCNAPIGINRLCMKQFRAWKQTDQYKVWEINYYKDMQKYMT